MLIYIHKEETLDDVARRYPAQHYVLVDDKPRILAAVKDAWGDRVTTIFPRQGQYARDAERYRASYEHAIAALGAAASGRSVIEAPGIQTVAHRDGHAHRQALLGLDFQALCFRFGIVSQRRAEHFLARVV